MNLLRLQQAFLASLREGHEPPVADPRGLRVYANNSRGQLLRSLCETYERALLWLGDDAFDTLAHTYIDAHPSASWNLNEYGPGFPAYLAHALPLPDPAAELAWLDHALREAFYGRDATPMALHEVAVADWEQAAFTFLPTLRFQIMLTNAPAIWSAISAGAEVPAACLLPTPVAVRVWRSDLTPRFASMSAEETACLDLALAGGTFGDICALLAVHKPHADIAEVAGRLLREWFTEGMVVSVA